LSGIQSGIEIVTFLTGGCGGTARIKDDTLYLGKDHTCGDMTDEFRLFQAKARMKFRAGQTTEPLRDIWNSVLSQSSESVKKNLKFETAEAVMRNKRRKNLPPIPKTLPEMKNALENGHPFDDIYQGFVEFEDGKVAFMFGDPALLAIVESKFLIIRLQLVAVPAFSRNIFQRIN